VVEEARTQPDARPRTVKKGQDRFFAVSPPGLEQFVLRELKALGIQQCEAEQGGVSFTGDATAMQRANLHLRTATRVLLRVASFHSSAFHELERNVRRIHWERFLPASGVVRLRVTCRKSRLYHSDAVAERIARSLDRSVEQVSGDGSDEAGTNSPGNEQMFVVRLDHDICSISADTSGRALYFRGYREATAKAPVRETLAAALVHAADWRGDIPLLDPMCGSGTIPIEAALIARRIAPGIAVASREPRMFAFRNWPEFDDAVFLREVERARSEVIERAPEVIAGSDRDAGAIEAASSNAARAGVVGDVDFDVRAISAVGAPGPAGVIVSNPPYGKRVGDERLLRNLYARLGRVLRAEFAGWTVVLLSGSRPLEARTGLNFRPVARTRNGGIPVRIVCAAIDG
jgi:putative N6-adenine-specific DNA methylase